MGADLQAVIRAMLGARTTEELERAILAVEGMTAADVAFALEIADIVRANLSLAAERVRLTAELDRLARTDPVTGLPNRRVLEERLENELHRSARSRHAFALAILDLDAPDDEASERFANALRAHARNADFAARFGAREFALILIDVDPPKARGILERILEAISQAQLTASAGVTLSYPVDSAESIVERAEAALYQAKQTGPNRAVFG